MGDNRFGNLQPWEEQADNPAAPEGMRQAAQAGAGYADGSNRFSNLGKWMATTEENPYTANAASWYTGFNAEGTNNGWDTEFTRQFIDGQNKAAKEGTLSTYFEDGGTGVVTWDHKSSDDRHEFHFGDVVEKGNVVGNVYDLYDKGDADLAMSTWLFDGTEQSRIFSDSDPVHALRAAVASKQEQNNADIPKAMAAAETQAKIDDRTASIAEGKSQAAIVGGAALASGATTAAAGAALTSWLGPGALIGGAAGFLGGAAVGGVGAYFNRDELDQQAARAYEITALANETEGTGAAAATFVNQWAGFTTNLTSPLTQASHGLADTLGKNKAGDQKSGFYAVDGKGQSTRAWWLKPLSLAAATGDGLLQFVSPLGRLTYTAQMGGTITGEVGQLALTGGKTYDPRRGGFDNIFTDDNGNFDPVSGAAGILKVGIDAVQLGGWRGLARATGLRAGAAEAHAVPHELAGYRAVTNEAGEIIGKKKTMALLAPSEQVAAINAAREARIAALKEGRAVRADDFFKAASRLHNGSNKLKAAMLNGFGEGYEEAVQAILEPLSVQGKQSFNDITNAFFYGAAAGAGMGLGVNFSAPTNDQKLSAAAFVTETIRRGGVEPDHAAWDAEWATLTDTEKRVRASRTKADATLTAEAIRRFTADQAATDVATELDAAKALDARRTAVERDLNSATPGRTDTFTVMSGLLDAGRVDPYGNITNGTAPAEAIEASALTIFRMLENRLNGLEIQQSTMATRVTELTAQVSDPAVEEKLAEAASMVDSITLARAVGENLLGDVGAIVDEIYAADEAGAQQLTAQLNKLLEGVYRGTLELNAPEGVAASPEQLRDAGMNVVTLLHAREPKLDSGSYLAMLPRVSWELTRSQSDNLVQVNTDILQAINGDFDGDKLRAENQMMLTPARFAQLRAGQNLGGATAGVDIATRNFDAALSAAVGEGLTSDGQLGNEARAVLGNIELALGNRYGQMMSPEAMRRVMDEFRVALVAGSAEARTTLLNSLAREAGGKITELGTSEMHNEWLWISKVVRANLQAYQTSYRQLRNQQAASSSPGLTVQVLNNTAVAFQDGQPIGLIQWTEDGTIDFVGVLPAHRRRGIASKLKRAAQDAGYTLKHSPRRTQAGDAWARSFTTELPSQDGNRIAEDYEGYESGMTARIQQELAAYVGMAPVVSSRGPSATEAVADFDTPVGTNRRKTAATNAAQTLALFAVGNSLFRKFQSIHYTWYNSSVLSAAGAEYSDLYAMAALYEELSRGVTRAELELVSAEDPITGRALVMLRRLVDSALNDPEMAGMFDPNTAMSVLANVKVKDVWFSKGEPVTDGTDISLVQLLLRRSLDQDREEHKLTFELDEKLQARHARLRSLTTPNDVADDVRAEKAFIEVFGATPFLEALGGVTGHLAPHTTPQQWLRSYSSLDAEGRQLMEREFTNVPEYLDRKEKSNLPYTLSEASHGGISSYRSMMDALMAVGRALPRDRAQISKTAEADFIAGHQLVTKALADFRSTTNRRDRKRVSTADLARQLLTENPQFGRQVLAMIPDAAANAVFEFRDGELYIAPWIYRMFEIENPAEAAFYYWKNLTLAQWFSTQVTVREDDKDAPGRAYNKLQSRFQRLMYQFAKEPGQPRLELLIRKMDEVKDLDTLFTWINTAPGMKGNLAQADFLPFHDDVADFEADASGGWVTSRSSGDLRAAIAAMATGAKQLQQTMAFREEKAATDRIILDGIIRARNNDPEATPLDHENLRKLAKAVNISTELPRGFAPNAMLALGRGVMRSVDAHSHDKGVSPDSYQPLGEFQALMDAFSFVPNLERTMETLTAHSVSSLRSNIGDVAKHGGTAMDAYGRPIVWEKMTLDQAIEMLDDPRTAPLAHMLLTPSALDITPNGSLSERLLMDASLQDLLDEDHYRDLFFTGENDEERLDRAYRYISLLDSRARHEGGNFDATRAVHDRAIALTSGLGRPATEDDNTKLLNQAYLEVAAELQLVGRIQSSPLLRDAGTLATLRDKALQMQHEHRLARELPGFVDNSGKVVPEFVDLMLANLHSEQESLKQALIGMYSGEELDRRTEGLRAQYALNEQRVRDVLKDDIARVQAERFAVTGDAAQDTAAHAQIVAFVKSMANFPSRAPEAAETWSKLANQLQEGRRPDLTSTEWDTLSRAAMGVAMIDQVLRVASHVSVPSFPTGDPAVSDARFYKYLDTSYSFTVNDILAEDTPLAAAAQWLHTTAEQPTGMMSIDAMVKVLQRGMLNRTQYGAWTPGLMSQLVEAQQRMDSAAAGEAIAAAGNGPKRWAAVMAATRRLHSKQVPGSDRLTTVRLTGNMLTAGADRFNEIAVTPAGSSTETTMPVALLDNRFVSAIRLTLPGGEQVDLPLETDNLGFTWADQPVDTPYRYISLDRLGDIVTRHAAKLHSHPIAVQVEVDFFHPDSQPAGPEWMNNAFFEGMNHTDIPDGSESLIATLWSDNGGQISLDTQRPLDAGKKGLPAIQPFKRINEAAVAEAENLWVVGNNMAAMLRRKTELILTNADDMSLAHFNAVYKSMKLQHLVVGYRDGKPAAMTADEVIAHQNANGHATPLPLDGAKLVKISPDVLRTLMGDTGDQGVARFFDDEYLLNPDLVAPYVGISERALGRFAWVDENGEPKGWLADAGGVGDTVLANVGAQRTMRVRTMLPDSVRNARQERIVNLNNRSAEVRSARAFRIPKAEARAGYLTALKLAAGSVSTERSTFDFGDQGLPLAPRNVYAADHTGRLLKAMRSVAEAESYERGWQVMDEGAPDYPGGVLTVESLNEDRPIEHHIVKGDLAVLRLDSFERPERDVRQVQERVEKALRHLANTGATIVLGSGNGGGDLRYESAQFLKSLGYAAVAGSAHLYAPVEVSYQSQNERAYESTLAETRRFHPARNVVTFLATDPIGTDENFAVRNPGSRKLRDRKRLNNILPSSTYPNYNLPLDDNRTDGLYSRALTHLRSVTDPANAEAREVLLKQAGADPSRVMPIRDALDRFHARISNRSSLALEVGDTIEVGDIVPFVHPDGRVVLYRHGLRLPKPEKLRDLQDQGGLNVALATSEIEPAITANAGTIVEVRNRSVFGRTLAIETPLQEYGDKIQLEWNGMKYVVVPPPDGSDIATYAQVPVFGNGTLSDLFSDVASANSKEAYEGRVFNYRNALAFFQFDFTDDLVKFFYPDEKTRPAEAAVMVYSMLDRLSNQHELEIPMSSANVIAKANVALADLLGSFAVGEQARSGVPADWSGRLAAPAAEPSDVIAQSVITYLLTPGAHIDNVLKSAGFSHPQAHTDIVQTRMVPGLFADLLDQGLDSKLHKELIRRFDAQLHRGADGSGYKLHSNWEVEIFDGKGSSLRGYLQFGEAHSSGDNPRLDGQAFHPSENGAVSAHNAMAASGSIGAITAHKVLARSRAFAKSFTRDNGAAKFASGDSMWQALTELPNEKDSTFDGWRRETHPEMMWRLEARQEQAGFYQPLNPPDWTDQQRAEYEAAALQVLNLYNLYGSQVAMIDVMVRDHLGRPAGVDEHGVERGDISWSDAMQALTEMRNNNRDGLLPHAGAHVPLIDINHLTAMYLANHNRTDGRGWAPRLHMGVNAPRATTWDQWVECAFGTAWILSEDETSGLGVEPNFDEMYRLAVDGRMHGYQGATTSTRYLPVASSELRQRRLLDPETGRMLVSISADQNLLATDPTLFHATKAELDDILTGQRIYGPGRHGPDPSSAKGRQRKRIERWRNEVDMPRQVGKTMRGVRGPGQTFLGHSTTTSAFWRSMFNLRTGKSLFNVALIVSAPIEAFQRRTVNAFADAIVGEGTGAVGQLHSRISDAFKDKAIGKVAEQLGLTSAYTTDQQKQLNKLVDALSTLPDFKAMVYKELMYQYPTMPGIGKVEKWLEHFAKFGARLQDPAWGMLPKDLARLYVSTVMRRMSADPTGENIYSVERLMAQLSRNPQWLHTNDLETHNMAIAAIANIRSVKPNVLSLGFRGGIQPLAENHRWAWNSTGNLLKVMTVFQNFWSSYAINITGLQGPADFMAFLLDGRQKKITARMQAAARGETYNPDDPEYFDMSEVIESVDLADSFIKGGVTHAGLFMLGMLSGGLNLSGEDDEEKFRRRQAELQGAGFVHDPRKIENDFRNKGSIYLNWLPMGMDSWFRVDPNNPDSPALAQMNWITRSILSPIIGFERFYNTGDFSEVLHGFGDAIGSHPIVNEQLWNAASDTANELHSQAADAAARGDHVAATHFLTTAVGVLEYMMLENSMANMIYVGTDRYDRDPYSQPKLDSDKNPQGDVRGNSYETDTLTTFRNADNEIAQAYVARDGYGAQIRALTENRFGLALLGSLYTGITGGGFTSSDMFRRNMPEKVRQIELMPTSIEEIKGYVAAAYGGAQAKGGVQVPNLTAEEIASIEKNRQKALGGWVDYGAIDDWAVGQAKLQGPAELSEVKDGREVLTEAGHRAVFEGLLAGTVQLGSAALNGVFADQQMREKIQTQWMRDIKQDGVNMGLTQSQATYRMRRIWFGDAETGADGIFHLLWDKTAIPYTDTLRYSQLNTTYVTGPSGYPMATGFTRDGLFGALGLKPVNRLWSAQTGMSLDSRGNSVDDVVGINTGLRGLEPRPENWEIPSTEDEIRAAAEKIADAIGNIDLPTQSSPAVMGSHGGYSGYGHHSYGGGGGGGYSGYANYSKMYALPSGVAPYGNAIPFINTSNPIIRRADIRRERVWSERGRLNQWQ